MYNYLLTTSLGLEALAKREILKFGYNITNVTDRGVYFDGEEDAIARVNLNCRFGNIVYLELLSVDYVDDFNVFFDYIYSIDWEKYIDEGFFVKLKAKSIKSKLFSEKSLQSLAKKAIVKKNSINKSYIEDQDIGEIGIQILIKDNKLKVLLNTSGDGLHKRGYRAEAGEAPIKENIAAAIVDLSRWSFKDNFCDPFCGSGTIAIEAAMIARNIAPGKFRRFAFENFSFYDNRILEFEKKLALKKEYNSVYNITASDIDSEAIGIAEKNAKNAGVLDTIKFSQSSYDELKFEEGVNFHIVSNPPYGLRLREADIKKIYNDISSLYIKGDITGGIITSLVNFDRLTSIKYKKRKLYNGGELCYFYSKMT